MEKTPKPISESLIVAIRAHVRKLNRNDGKMDTETDDFDVYRAKGEGNQVTIPIQDSFYKDERRWVGLIMSGIPCIILRKNCIQLRCMNGSIHISINALIKVPYKMPTKEEEIERFKAEIALLKEEKAMDKLNFEKQVAIFEEEKAMDKLNFEKQVAIFEEETNILREELKRKRLDEENIADVIPNDEMKTEECRVCMNIRPLSSFRTKSNRKNKEGNNVEYCMRRTICHSCKGKKARANKKAKVSK